MGQDTEIRRLRGFGDTTVALVARGTDEGAGADSGAAPLPEVAMTFESQGDGGLRWRVRHFEVIEGLSTLYECAIDLAAGDFSENPDTLLGRYALLQVQRDTTTVRRFYGLVRRVEHRGTTATHRLARVYTVPALWTLSQRSDARVYQGMSAIEVVEAVLQEAGLYAGMLDVRLQRRCLPREYCVQYRETDLAFVRRLLESEGVAFFFRHDEESETLVLADGSHAYEAARTMDGGPIPIAGAEGRTHRVETVRRLTWEREQRPTGVVVRDFDFTRPDYRIERMAPRRREGERNLYEPAPGLALGQYAGAMYTQENGQEQAQARLEAERVGAAVGTGEGVVVGLSPGALFQLSLAGSYVPEQHYLVTEVMHTGDAPEVFAVDATEHAADEDRYRNRFRCVPVEVPFRPARETPRPVIAGLQTAVVTGPAGEEIYTDEHGRIKVQFHWDRTGTRDEHTTAWLRVMQGPWAGNGWGFQFLPRVGMEVAVSFLEGDPDRPVVIGALYNGQNRAPYALPEDKSRSAIKSQTTPGGNGYNEIRFEDAAGREEVFLHAQRDLAVRVLNDHLTGIDHDQDTVVRGDRRIDVTGSHHVGIGGHEGVAVDGDQDVNVRRNRSVFVGEHQRLEVLGSVRESSGDAWVRAVGGDHLVNVGRSHDLHVAGSLLVDVRGAGAEGAAMTSQVQGSAFTHATREITLRGDEQIVLMSGQSRITLTPDGIELAASVVKIRADDEVLIQGGSATARLRDNVSVRGDECVIRSDGATLDLGSSTATLQGSRVALSSGGGASASSSSDSGSEELTTRMLHFIVSAFQHERDEPAGALVVLDGEGREARRIPASEGRYADERITFELDPESLPEPAQIYYEEEGRRVHLFGPASAMQLHQQLSAGAHRQAASQLGRRGVRPPPEQHPDRRSRPLRERG